MYLVNIPAEFEARSFIHSWDNSDCSFGLGLRTHNLGEWEAVGGRDGKVWKSIGEFLLALHSNFSSIFTRFRDIAAFVLQHSTFPTPPLVSPKFSYVPLGLGG